MSDDISLRVIQLAGQGFCCSQIMLVMALEMQGSYNTELVRAAAGLCKGFGDCSGPCGALSGGACLLSLYAGRGSEEEEADNRLPQMLESLRDWFLESKGGADGDVSCLAVMGLGECGEPDPTRCGGVVAETFAHCLEILEEYDFDPTVAREEL